MANVRIKLTHSSDHPKAKGKSGDIIEAPAEIAKRFIDGNGAFECDKDGNPKKDAE